MTIAESASPRQYWSVRAGGKVHEDLAWSYPTPLPESQTIAGLIAFYNENVDLYVDGVRQELLSTLPQVQLRQRSHLDPTQPNRNANAHAVSRPPHVNLAQAVVMPTRQPPADA